jgi:hypothetical protein
LWVDEDDNWCRRSFETPLRQAQRLLRTNGTFVIPFVLRRD